MSALNLKTFAGLSSKLPFSSVLMTALMLSAACVFAQAPAGKPSEGKPVEAKPADGKPAEAKPDAAKPAGAPTGGAPAGGGGPVAVEVTKATKGTVSEDVTSAGTVKAAESVILRADIVGRIAKLNFKDGDKVKKGQILIVLDDALPAAEKEQAQAELALAISNLKRTQDLADKQFLSPRAKDEAESQVKILEAKLKLSEARLQRYYIRAPFDGALGLRNVSVGDYVKDGSDIVTIDDVSKLRVDFKLAERYSNDVKVGQKVMIEPDAQLKIKPMPSKVDAIDTVLDTNGRALTLRARIGNPKGALRPGMFVRSRVILTERKDVVLLPEEAVVPGGGGVAVFKIVDGKSQRVAVKIGARQNGKVEIKEGVVDGETIIVAGQQRLNRDGTVVKVSEGRGGKPPEGGKPADGDKKGGKPEMGKPEGEKKGGKPDGEKSGKPEGGKPNGKPSDKKE